VRWRLMVAQVELTARAGSERGALCQEWLCTEVRFGAKGGGGGRVQPGALTATVVADEEFVHEHLLR
jgi:hypothetical protein